jgi:hypothetical protein
MMHSEPEVATVLFSGYHLQLHCGALCQLRFLQATDCQKLFGSELSTEGEDGGYQFDVQ